jgi:hypothetical protein
MSILRTIPYAVLSGSLLVGGGAYAQSMYSIDQRQDYQQDQIERGIRNGQVTRSEAYRLEQGERAIDRAQARARADGVVTPQERARIDRLADREGREIYRQSHDSQQSWDRGQNWGRTDGRYDGWRDNGGRHDGWGRNAGGDRDGDRGNHYGWNRGQHNGWDGNRPNGIERRDARDEQRIRDGVRDGSLTRGEARGLQNGQNRIDRYEARARSDGNVSPYERNRIDQMQNRESRQIYAGRHNGQTAPGSTPTTSPSGGWNHQPQAGNTTPTSGGSRNGGWQHQPQAGGTTPTTGTQPGTGGSHNWGNGGWRTQQAGGTTPTAPTTGTQPSGGSRNYGGYRMQQASSTPAATPTMTRASAPAPTMTRASAPAPTMTRAAAPSGGGRSYGGRH